MKHDRRFVLALVIVGFLTACSGSLPKPWEKDLLAKPAMAMDSDALDMRFLQLIYTSKENSSGGGSVGGGGCGCN